MVVVSIDPSTSKEGIAIFVDGKLEWSKQRKRKSDGKNFSFFKRIFKKLKDFGEICVAVEEWTMGPSAIAQARHGKPVNTSWATISGLERAGQAWATTANNAAEELEIKIRVGRVAANRWQGALGMGGRMQSKERKKKAVEHAKLVYGIDAGEDQAEAICQGQYVSDTLMSGGDPFAPAEKKPKKSKRKSSKKSTERAKGKPDGRKRK